jgi:pimeloyl-ACP methyl ester carboxylesterase
MQLNTIVHGQPTDRPPLVIAHGLFGSGRNWGAIAKRLAARRQVIAVDMRNHGDSPRATANDYLAMAGDLGETIAGLGVPADLLGHSMGGKAAMVLALTEPARIRRLIVADMAPVAYDRSQLPYVTAMQAVDLARVTRRSEAEAALAAAVAEPGVRAFLAQSLVIDGAGASWKLNLPVLGAEMPKIMGFPEVAGRFDGPALFVTGARSDYVQPDHRARIAALFPAARHRALAGAGHWLHADAPAAFIAAVEEFLAE